VHAEGITQAEKSYSEDMLLSTMFEILDTHPECEDVLYAFQGAPASMPIDEVYDRLQSVGVTDRSVVELLVWFGFFGVTSPAFPEVKYANSVQDNLRRLMYPLSNLDGMLVIHPAFRAALDIEAA
jgi:hypothetical protein